jgi:hypothetical protein
VRLLSIIFIEFVRGVPLITVLIMANTMLPLFLPQGMSIDRLLRPLVGVALFASAYMAEVVRGGLQAMPKGQYEGAMSLGLNYWKTMVFIILPQALRIVIPGIVNTFIGLFKDTTLVYVIGVFDFVRTIEARASTRPGPRRRSATRATPSRRSSTSSAAGACRATRSRSSSGLPPANDGDPHGDGHDDHSRGDPPGDRRRQGGGRGSDARRAQVVRRLPCAARPQPPCPAQRAHRHLRPLRAPANRP